MAAINPTTFLTAGAATQGMSAVGGAFSQANAIAGQAQYQQKVAEINSKIADFQATDALQRGGQAAARALGRSSQAVSSERASAAGQGINVNTGSAADIQDQTGAMGRLDALTIQNNAMREAFGYKSQAASYTAQGQFAGIAGQNAYANTLVTGGMQALGYGFQGAYYGSGGRPGYPRGGPGDR